MVCADRTIWEILWCETNVGTLLVFMMMRTGGTWEFLEMEELEYELAVRGIKPVERNRWCMVDRLQRIVEPRERDLRVVEALDLEGEAEKFRGALTDLGCIMKGGGGVVTRNKTLRLEARLRHWEGRLRDLERVCRRPSLVEGFRRGLRELDRVRIASGGKELERPGGGNMRLGLGEAVIRMKSYMK